MSASLRHVQPLGLYECLSGVEHGVVRGSVSLLEFGFIEKDVGLEGFPLTSGQLKVGQGDDLSGALSLAHVADGEFACISPVAVERRVFLVGGDRSEVLEHTFDFAFAGALDKSLEAFVPLAFLHEALGETGDDRGYILGRHSRHRQTEGAGVLQPLTPQHNLEVGYGDAADLAADAVEADVGGVVLSARVEASADLDPQAFYGFVERVGALGQPAAQLGREAARRGDAELAGVGARAGGDVEDGTRTRQTQSEFFQVGVESRQIGLAHPAQDEVLLHRRANGVLDIATADVCQSPKLIRGEVTQR